MTIEIALQRIAESANNNATELNLSGLGLTEVPSEVFALTSLEYLNLQGNQISSVPTEISLMPNLREIDLAENKLTSCPPILGALDLKGGNTGEFRVYLEDNNFSAERIAEALANDSIELDLTRCGLTEIPIGILALPNLKSLDLSGNKIAHISPDLVTKINELLPNLTDIHFADNCFEGFPTEILALTNLESLDLQANQIATVSRDADLSQCPLLNLIDLSDNPIGKAPTEVSFLDELESRLPNLEIYI